MILLLKFHAVHKHTSDVKKNPTQKSCMFSTLFDHFAVTRTTLKTNAIIVNSISAELQNKNQKQFVTCLYSIKEFQC